MCNIRLQRLVLHVTLVVAAHVLAITPSCATTILTFSQLNSSTPPPPVTINHTGGSSHLTTVTSAPIGINIFNAPLAAMNGVAYLFFIGVQSTTVPDFNYSFQDGFSGTVLFSKSNTPANAAMGLNLILQATFTNAQLSLVLNGGALDASNDSGLSQDLTMTSAYLNLSGSQALGIAFSTSTPPTIFSTDTNGFDQSFTPPVLYDVSGTASAALIAVPEPSTFVTASLGILALFGTVRRRNRFDIG